MPKNLARIAATISAAFVLIAGATTGVASATAKTSNDAHAKVHHVAKAAKRAHKKAHKKNKKKAKISRRKAAMRKTAARKTAAASKTKTTTIKITTSKTSTKTTTTSSTSTPTPTPTPTTSSTPTTTTPSTSTPTPTTTTSTTTTPSTPTTTTTTPTTTTTTPTTDQPLGVSGSWHLTLDSEFSGSSLPADWKSGWFGSGVTGPVNSYETSCYSPSNVTFPGDGTMHLNVTATSSTCGGKTEPNTGAIVTTNPEDGRTGPGFQYTYGVLEARVYIPADGTEIADWPAVWADGQSWPNDGEDDIMEGLAGQSCFHFISPLGDPGSCDATLTPGWHTFASDWQPGSITYYYDGNDVGTITTGVTSSPQYIIIDNTTATPSWNSAGPTMADSMQIQYVKVWQQA